MKLRLRGDTLRLRLTRSEVELISRGQPVSEQTNFGAGGALRYVLAPAAQTAASIAATDQGQEIRVEIAQAEAQIWADSEQVGFRGDAPFTIGPLEVLIEKDFNCITPREGEAELDTFPNPNSPGNTLSAT